MFIPTRKLIFLIFTYTINTIITLAQPDFRHYVCGEADGNYTTNSTYQRNLDITLSTLHTTNSGFGFFNLSTGQGNDRVNSAALCQGDMDPDLCLSCLNDSTIKLREVCPNQKEAVGYYGSGYMAPEYAMRGRFSVKSDVFSFGVLVLELVTGQKNQCFQNGESAEYLLGFAWKSWRNGTTTNMIDPTLKARSGSLGDIIRSIHIGLLCVQENVSVRPTISSVVLMLNSNSLSFPVPSEPAFFINSNTGHGVGSSLSWSTHSKEPKISKSTSSQCSINDVSISDIVRR